MKILFVASEVDPFAKTGGLADVAAALPKALAQLGHDVRIIMPRYRAVDPKKFSLKPITPSVWQGALPKSAVPVYFIEQPSLFDRDGLYQDRGADWPDNLERFSVFSQAALAAVEQLGWQPEIVHCHDWQASLVCAHLALTRARDPFWQSAGTVLTIHNLAYQGLFPESAWSVTNLPREAFTMHGLEFYGKINCLKGGLVYADVLTTVSPTYAKEIQLAEFGCGLEGVLASRRDDLLGILNGIDPDEWNPQTDPHTPAKYSVDKRAGKAACKRALQAGQKLPQQPVLLIGMIQRLAEQKGIDIFVQAAEELLAMPLQIVILGTGDPAYHQKLTGLARRFPEQLAVNLTFNNALAHQIEAGCDAFLMPSRFEPCGLNQMYSMRYGTVPIVRRVGGLADTVTDRTTGFVFEDYSAPALVQAVTRAAAAFGDRTRWDALMANGMRLDTSWTHSAGEYVKVYQRALAKPPVAAGR